MHLPDGWLWDEEAAELARLAEGRTILELGAWKGRSTTALASTARYVVSVDRHRGIPDVGNDSLSEYIANVRSLPNVAMVVASFEEFVPLLGHFDLVYVDGEHTAEAVARDVRLAVARDPEVIAFHDWDLETVRQGAWEILDWPPASLIGSVAVYRMDEA